MMMKILVLFCYVCDKVHTIFLEILFYIAEILLVNEVYEAPYAKEKMKLMVQVKVLVRMQKVCLSVADNRRRVQTAIPQGKARADTEANLNPGIESRTSIVRRMVTTYPSAGSCRIRRE